MISDRRILCIGSNGWEEPGELQVICEILSGANNVIWVNPFGSFNANLLPRIEHLKENLTVYNPGINFLPLPFLGRINRSRLLLHTKMYLLERDFEPELVIIDSPELINFAAAYKKSGSQILYYAKPIIDESITAEQKAEVRSAAHYVYKPRKVPYQVAEEDYLAFVNEEVEAISKLISV
jgi:hypothetical protein